MANQHSQQSEADRIARQMGYPDAATYLAWQQRQSQIVNLPAQTVAPPPKAPPPNHVQSILDSIMSYLPLGSLQKAGKAMDEKK